MQRMTIASSYDSEILVYYELIVLDVVETLVIKPDEEFIGVFEFDNYPEAADEIVSSMKDKFS